MYPSLWEQQSPVYTPLPFDSLCEHMFSISVWSVSEMCDTRESRVSGVGVYVEMGCQALFTLASTSCEYQPAANCQPAFTPAASRPALLSHPAHSPRPRLDFHCRILGPCSRDPGQVDSPSQAYNLRL